MLITLSDGQVITITNWYSLHTSRIEQFEFADGRVWAPADILDNMVVKSVDSIKYFENLIEDFHNEELTSMTSLNTLNAEKIALEPIKYDDFSDVIRRIKDIGIIDPGWLPQTPIEGINNVVNGEFSNIQTEEEKTVEPIKSGDLSDVIRGIKDIGIIDPGWLPQTPIEGNDYYSIEVELNSAFNQLVQAHSSFNDITDETGFDKNDNGYRYTLPVPVPLI
jgi:hypothetical protein